MLCERETIEWSNFWWENANKECRRLLLIGDSVTRGYRSSLNSFLAEYDCVVDICAFSATISNTLTEKMINCFFSFDEYAYEYIGIQMGGNMDLEKSVV